MNCQMFSWGLPYAGIHVEPLGGYSHKWTTLAALPQARPPFSAMPGGSIPVLDLADP